MAVWYRCSVSSLSLQAGMERQTDEVELTCGLGSSQNTVDEECPGHMLRREKQGQALRAKPVYSMFPGTRLLFTCLWGLRKALELLGSPGHAPLSSVTKGG